MYNKVFVRLYAQFLILNGPKYKSFYIGSYYAGPHGSIALPYCFRGCKGLGTYNHIWFWKQIEIMTINLFKKIVILTLHVALLLSRYVVTVRTATAESCTP